MIILNDVRVKWLLLVTFRADLTILGGPERTFVMCSQEIGTWAILIESSLINVDDFSASYHLALVMGTGIEINYRIVVPSTSE